jgi:hypothetical protein
MTGGFEAGFAKHRRLVLRSIFALCLLGATFNHWSEIRQHGFLWDYGGCPRSSTLFWTALAFLDPMAAVLLFVRPNTGIVATVSIIVADVIHNVWIQARYFPPLLHGLGQAPQVVAQIAFMLFVLATAPFGWSETPPRS